MIFDVANTTTEVFWKNAASKTRYTFNCGGTRSSKTYSLMQLAYLIANKHENKIISVVSESLPHLKKGAMRDFFNFLKSNELYSAANHNKTENSYKCGSSIIEFFGVDSADKVHGPGRDYLFANEIQNIKYETFFQLCMRTTERIFADYNPVEKFWVYPEFLENPQYKEDLVFVHSTILNNRFAPAAIVKDVLKRAERDPNYKKVYLEGVPGVLEGLVFDSFQTVPQIPAGFKYIGSGLDFGFTNDPTACVDIYLNEQTKELLFDELFYETGLQNPSIARLIKQHHDKPYLVWADCAEPKSIAEIKGAGANIKPCVKGKDSVNYGLGLMKQHGILVTTRSLNLINEFRHYKFLTDRDGKPLNVPEDDNNHAIDAARYGCMMSLKKQEYGQVDYNPWSNNG